MCSRCREEEAGSCEVCKEATWGFSLVELLVVIGIISILTALITAGAMAAQKKIRQTHCAHNVGQLGLALQVFVTDNHVYPLSVNPKYLKGVETEHQTVWTTA